MFSLQCALLVRNFLNRQRQFQITHLLTFPEFHLPTADRFFANHDMNCIQPFFTYKYKDLEYFSAQYKQKIGLPLTITGATPQTVRENQIRVLVEGGMAGIRMGIQSGAEKTKEQYKRGASNKTVQKATRIINEHRKKLTPQYDLIIDNPYESDEEIVETLMLLSTLPTPFVMAVYSLTFYPGTELYNEARRDGLITDDHKEVYRKYYHSCQKTYLNGLYFLIRDYAKHGSRIPTWVMYLMTRDQLRSCRLSHVVYAVMLAWKVHFIPKRMAELTSKTIGDLSRGDVFRIKRKIKRYARKISSLIPTYAR